MSSAIVRTLPKQYSTFSPTTIPGCALWLDGADRNSITGTSYVTGMVNKANTTEVFSANGTGLTFSTINSVPSINFPGTGSSYLFYASSKNLTIGTSFVMFLNTSTNSQYTPFYIWKGTSDYQAGLGWTSSNTIGPYVSNAGNQTPSTSIELNTPYIVAHQWTSGSTTNLALNGGTPSTGTIRVLSAESSPCLIQIGADYGTNLKANIGEILIYNNILTTQQVQSVEGYLAWKWGLRTNVPVTHPFKSIQVFTRPFQPTDIDSCNLWLDAADRSTFTLSGTTITQWRDKSGKSDITSGGTYNAIGALGNKLSTMRLSNAYAFTTNQIGISGASPQTYVVVCNTSGTANDFTFLHWLTSGGGAAYGGSMLLSVNRASTSLTINQVTLLLTMSGLTQAKTKLAIGTHTGSLAALYESGTAGGTISNTMNQTNGTMRFGIGTDNVEIGEIIVYNKSLSNSERQQIEGYLGWKWGLQGNLPSTQLFKRYRTPNVLFNPLLTSNCYMWIDALDSSTVSLSGNNVTGALDKSGNGRNLTGGTGFTYNQTKFNTIYPSFYNVGASPNSIGKNTSFTGLAQPITFFIVGRPLFGGAELYPYMFDGPDGVGRIGPYFASSTQVAFFGGGTSLVYNGTFTSPYIFCFTANTTTSQIIYNGSVVATGSFGTNTLNGIILGSRFSGSTYTGHICEFIMYNKLCSTYEIKLIEGYLAWKWGLQRNVTTGHPHYTTRS